METIIARQSSHHPRRAFHSISHAASVWCLVSRWPCLCRIAVAIVVVCVEPRGPASPIGVPDIQTTAVMRREFGTTEPPSTSEVELGRGRANGLVHVHPLPPQAALFWPFVPKPILSENAKENNRTPPPCPRRLRARARAQGREEEQPAQHGGHVSAMSPE